MTARHDQVTRATDREGLRDLVAIPAGRAVAWNPREWLADEGVPDL